MEVQNFQIITAPVGLESNKANTRGYAPKDSLTQAEIQAWLVSYLAELLEVDQDEIDVTITFDSYGLDSSAAVGLSGDLQNWLKCELDATLLYDYPTVEALALHLADELKVKA